MPSTSPCTLRINPATNTKGGVVSDVPDPNNKYNHNFQNKFCGCECDYDPHEQKGTMFQCMGLGTVEEGGCGEDWWHPSCLVGLGPQWMEEQTAVKKQRNESGSFLATIAEVAPAVVETREQETVDDMATTGLLSRIGDAASAAVGLNGTTEPSNEPEDEEEDDDPPPPPGFPHEDDFEGFICYKCVDANPWIKRYADAPGFLGPVFRRSAAPSPEVAGLKDQTLSEISNSASRKRKAEDDTGEDDRTKRVKDEKAPSNDFDIETVPVSETVAQTSCKYQPLPTPPPEQISLFFKPDFRDHICHCSSCFPRLAKHPQLLEEEDTYEPPISESAGDGGASTVGSGSIYERGESVLKNVDRVKAIEGVMAYNHLKEKLMPFFKEFAESGKAISAEDIKAHFAKMRGDEAGIKEASEAAAKDTDNRREQGGY